MASLLFLLIYTSSAPPPYSDSDSNHATFWWLTRTIYPRIFPNWIIPLSWAIVIIVPTDRVPTQPPSRTSITCHGIMAYRGKFKFNYFTEPL